MTFLTGASTEARTLVEDLGRALLVIQETGQYPSASRIVSHIRDICFEPTHLMFEIDHEFPGDQYAIRLNPHYKTGSTIERLEVLLDVIYHAEDNYCLSKLCLGSQTAATFWERWRLLNAMQPLDQMRIARFEDRKACALCHNLIATDAPTVLTRNLAVVHEQCNIFLHNVMMPALRAQREAAKAAANAQA